MHVDGKIFQRLVEQVRDYAVFVLDPEGRVATWNTGAKLIKGYDGDEIIGRHFSTFYPEAAVKAGFPEHELRMATREGRFEDEGWRVRKDGSRFWASVIITALRDDNGGLLGFSKITRDLTSRRMAEESLRQSEERFRLLVEGVVDYAIFMLNEEGMITSWNTGAQRIKGYAPEEIIGRHFSRFYPPEDIDAGKPWEALATARKDGRVETEGWRVRKDGQKFWARAVITALYDSDGHLRGFAKVTQDLSQQRHARELEKTAQHVNEFIAMLAHELRNPLAPIRNAVRVMDRAPPADPVQEKMRRTIDRQSEHLARIVDDLVDVSRITRGTLAVEHHIVDLADVVARAVETVVPMIEQAKHVLNVDVPPGSIFVSGDTGRLTQVAANLLTNAVRFTPAGGRIWVKGSKQGKEAVLSLRDNGRGIAAENLNNIFNMFVQGRDPLHRVGGGLGIGLALARRIVALHHGSIEALSEGEGKGSEFIVRLPLCLRPAAAEDAPSISPVQDPKKRVDSKRILVVDDNVDAAHTLNELLLALGHETRVAYDGPEALLAADDFHPSIVLLDIGLPGISGYEVAKRLRTRTSQVMKIIAVTGWGQDIDRERSREAGFDEHLVKPVAESALLSL